jgi:hypothetical protein
MWKLNVVKIGCEIIILYVLNHSCPVTGVTGINFLTSFTPQKKVVHSIPAKIFVMQVIRNLVRALTLCIPVGVAAQSVQVITNHVGYENNLPKHAIIKADSKHTIDKFELIAASTGQTVYEGTAVYSGPVDKWKNWVFWNIDFSNYNSDGEYYIRLLADGKVIQSYPFSINKNVLEQATISDVVYYFKGQRCTGPFDEADRHLAVDDKTVDAHGGWYDATGDYGKHLSHLSFSTYFNPQQISLTAYSLFKVYRLLQQKPGTDYRQYLRRILDEATYGADYLTRMQVKDGSFYRSVAAPGPGKLAKDRLIRPEDKGYRIKQSKDQSYSGTAMDEHNWRSYQCSYRSGGGLSIAALAMAAVIDSNKQYLHAAVNAFNFLEKENVQMTNDGKENIVDDYCALIAATELYNAAHDARFLKAADKRANALIKRLSDKGYFIADDKDRPFFHPSDAGLPVVSLLQYYPVAAPAMQEKIRGAVKKNMEYELSITHAVNNPFGYSRQYTQDTAGLKKTSFFFPHGSEASPWWQGENARLGSVAAAARMAAQLLKDDKALQDSLETFALDQLNWILGLNPYDACMLQGTGHNNPAYGFFGTFEYTNAPGGIVNGITSGLEDEEDIDFNLSYAKTGKDYDWRWAEQWLPHAAWYLYAVSLKD